MPKLILFNLQHQLVQCSTVQYSTVQYSTVQYSTVQYSTVQYSTVQYSTVQYSTVQYSTVQYSTVQCQKNKKIVVYQLMIPLTMTRSSSRARQLLSRVNLTGFTVPTSGKIENICLFRKQLENILNNWLCTNFSCCPKILGCPKFFFGGGAAAPPSPRPVRLC